MTKSTLPATITAPRPPEGTPDTSNLLVLGWSNRNSTNKTFSNDPVETDGDRDGFFYARPGVEMKADLLTRMQNFMGPDSFWGVDGIHAVLESRIYAFDVVPRILNLHEDAASITTKICTVRPAAMEIMSDRIMRRFLGNSYDLGFEYVVGIGERISVDAMREAFPKAMARVFNSGAAVINAAYLPYAANRALEQGRPIVRREDEQKLVKAFFRALTSEDIPNLIKMANRDNSQVGSMETVRANWDLCEDYDGYIGTDFCTNTDDSILAYRTQIELHRDFVKAHAVCMGTVGDLMKRKVLEWPESRESWVKSAGRYALNMLTEYGREKNEREAKKAADIEALKNNTLSLPSPV